jgi:hypothetical protein
VEINLKITSWLSFTLLSGLVSLKNFYI